MFGLVIIYTLNHLRYNLHNFLSPLGPRGIEFRGPLWTPTRLIVNATVWSFAFGVPLLYLAIFRFRRTESEADNINRGIKETCIKMPQEELVPFEFTITDENAGLVSRVRQKIKYMPVTHDLKKGFFSIKNIANF